MRRKRLVAVSAFLLTVFGGCIYVTDVPVVSAEEFRAAVERDLPVGTPKAEVAAWLTARGYPFGDVADRTGRRCGYYGEFRNRPIDRLGMDFFPTYLAYQLTFDEQDRRTEYLYVRELRPSL